MANRKGEKSEINSQPSPAKVLQRVVGGKKQSISLINPKTRSVFNDGDHIEQPPVRNRGVSLQPSLSKTIVKPFSFEKRDMEMLTRKENNLRRNINEETKCRQFHAKPAPKFLNKTIMSAGSSSARPAASINEENKQPGCTFKARPAAVLHKKPFVPIKTERSLVEVSEFNFNTSSRVKKRQEYEIMRKERAANLKKIHQENEILLKKQEEKNRALLRQEIVHKPVPVPVYKPMCIKPSDKPLTIPQNPGVKE